MSAECKHDYCATQPECVMANGMTEQETELSPSVAGLIGDPRVAEINKLASELYAITHRQYVQSGDEQAVRQELWANQCENIRALRDVAMALLREVNPKCWRGA